MIGTPAALALSRNSPSGAAIFEQTCLGSSQRAFISSTRIAVLLLSSATGLGSGRLGPSSAANSAAEKPRNNARTAEKSFMANSPFSARAGNSARRAPLRNLFPQRGQISRPLHFLGEAVVVKRFRRRVGRSGAIEQAEIGHELDHGEDRFARDRRIAVERFEAETIGALEGLGIGLARVLGKNFFREAFLHGAELHALQGCLDQPQHHLAILRDVGFARRD